VMPPPKAERLVEKVGDTITAPTSTAAVSGTTAANTPPPNNTAATASSSTAPVAAPPRPAPRPAAPQDVTAIIAEQQRRQAAANPTPAPPLEKPPAETAKAVPQPAAPVTTPANTTTSTTSVSTTPRPGTAVVVDPDKPIDNPVMRSAYTARRKVVQTELPILGDTIELRFYDNAEIDGDSISLFLNDVALFQHVRLDARPYIFKLPVNELPENSELTMVAENLGAIPPNTAFMEAFVQGRRYSARLESTEQTSAVIRLVKKE
ncbi:MAG TPA: hypothetical protein VK907_05030, partial [Phnomibacter sp.]|nr:hypothetical protein [Phnomibacter sp.]